MRQHAGEWDNDAEAQRLLMVDYVARPSGGCNGIFNLEAEQAVRLVLDDAEGSGFGAAVEKATRWMLHLVRCVRALHGRRHCDNGRVAWNWSWYSGQME